MIQEEHKETKFIEDLEKCIRLISKGVEKTEKIYVQRALREVPKLRKKTDGEVLARVVRELKQKKLGEKENWQAVMEVVASNVEQVGRKGSEGVEKMEGVEESGKEEEQGRVVGAVEEKNKVEVAMFMGMVGMIYLLDQKEKDRAVKVSNVVLREAKGEYRAISEAIMAQIYFYYSRVYEERGQLEEIRGELLVGLQRAMQEGYEEVQGMVVTLGLRNYIQYKLYNQASKLMGRCAYPYKSSSNNMTARYLYYAGLVQAIELEYSKAHMNLQDASRKVSFSRGSAGFLQQVYKAMVVVGLLMGEIVEKGMIHNNKYLKKPLRGYLELVRAVRTGKLAEFQEVVERHHEQFLKDGLMLLIMRLRHNVIKAGIRAICTAYRRISLRDICLKLHLDSEEDAEYIVSKAIYDKVVSEATIVHEKGYVETRVAGDMYGSGKPQELFDARIGFCLGVYNDSVRAMRYPDSAIETIESKMPIELEEDDDGDSDESDLDMF